MKTIMPCVFFLATLTSQAQSMVEILRAMPRDYFDGIKLDSVIKYKTYLPSSNDDEIAERYQLTEVNDSLGTLRLTMDFTTGQRGFQTYDLRRFNLSNTASLLIFTRTSGTSAAFGQDIPEYFIIKNGTIQKSDTAFLPVLSYSSFLKADTPPEVITKLQAIASLSFELINFGERIAYVMYSVGSLAGFEPYLLGDTIYFEFENGRFTMLKPMF